MALSVSSVRSGLATRLATISGLMAYAKAPGQIQPPAAIVIPGKPLGEYNEASGGLALLNLRVVLLVQRADDEQAQTSLDAYLDPTGTSSVKAAIEADGTLGGSAHYAWVARVDDYGSVEWAGVEYLGATFDVEVQG